MSPSLLTSIAADLRKWPPGERFHRAKQRPRRRRYSNPGPALENLSRGRPTALRIWRAFDDWNYSSRTPPIIVRLQRPVEICSKSVTYAASIDDLTRLPMLGGYRLYGARGNWAGDNGAISFFGELSRFILQSTNKERVITQVDNKDNEHKRQKIHLE